MSPNPLTMLAMALRTGLITVAVAVALRRWAGATTAEPSAIVAAFIATMAFAAAIAAQWLDGVVTSPIRAHLAPGLSLAAAVALAGLLIPTGATLTLIYVVILTVATTYAMTELNERLAATTEVSPGFRAAEVQFIDSATVQQVTRQVADGVERIEGQAKLTFPAGKRTAVLHIPFSPALSGTPEVECEAEDGDVRIKTGAAFPYGIRLEVRRGGSITEQATVAIWFAATAPATDSQAA